MKTFMTAIVTMLSTWTVGTWLWAIALGLITAIVYEQLMYMLKRGSLPGPVFTIPFIGSIIHMVQAPYDFWHTQMAYGKLSWNAIIGRYLVMVTDSEHARKIFAQCSAEMPLILHPNAYRLLGRDNIGFLNGSGHKNLRASLLPLFTSKALTIYLHIQEQAIREHLNKWSEISKITTNGMEMRSLIYDLNINTSLSVFLGPYLTKETRKQFQFDYIQLTRGMFAAPIYFPGTQLYKGACARVSILHSLGRIVAASKQRMSTARQEPSCLLDFWMVTTLKAIDEAEKQNHPAPEHSTDEEVAKVVLDFIFAAQDASTSSLTFSIHELCKHPQILANLRAEQKAIRPDRSAPITPDTLTQMKYTWQVMKELLRLRPPATIVPHVALRPVKISDEYTAPTGTLIVPSIWSSNRVGFNNPEIFDPDRFDETRQEHIKFDKKFLTFGTGPHTCLGQRYAMNHIMLFIALLSDMEFERADRPNKDQIIYLPTIYPADGCVLKYIRETV